MALLTKKEFAAKCGKDTKWLAVYIKRGKVIVRKRDGDEDMIDTKVDKNAAFLEQYGISVFSLPAEVVESPQLAQERLAKANQVTFTDEEGHTTTLSMSDIPLYSESERLLKHLDTIKRQEEITKLQQDNAKKAGEVVPVEPIENLVFQFKQYVLTQQKLYSEKFLNEIGHKYTITPEDLAEYRGFFISNSNIMMIEATKNFNDNLAATLNEYSAKKSVGERS